MRMCDCGVKHIMHVRNDMIYPGDNCGYKAKPVYYNGEFISGFSIALNDIFHYII